MSAQHHPLLILPSRACGAAARLVAESSLGLGTKVPGIQPEREATVATGGG